jgi:hypothetical protein
MTVVGVLAFLLLSPIAIPLLVLWLRAARSFPRLERLPRLRNLALALCALALAPGLPIAVWSLFGMRSTGDSSPRLLSAARSLTAALQTDWWLLVPYVLAVLGWLLGARLIVPGLRKPLLKP